MPDETSLLRLRTSPLTSRLRSGQKPLLSASGGLHRDHRLRARSLFGRDAGLAATQADGVQAAPRPRLSRGSAPVRPVPTRFTESAPENISWLPTADAVREAARPPAQGVDPLDWWARLKAKGATARERAGLVAHADRPVAPSVRERRRAAPKAPPPRAMRWPGAPSGAENRQVRPGRDREWTEALPAPVRPVRAVKAATSAPARSRPVKLATRRAPYRRERVVVEREVRKPGGPKTLPKAQGRVQTERPSADLTSQKRPARTRPVPHESAREATSPQRTVARREVSKPQESARPSQRPRLVRAQTPKPAAPIAPNAVREPTQTPVPANLPTSPSKRAGVGVRRVAVSRTRTPVRGAPTSRPVPRTEPEGVVATPARTPRSPASSPPARTPRSPAPPSPARTPRPASSAHRPVSARPLPETLPAPVDLRPPQAPQTPPHTPSARPVVWVPVRRHAASLAPPPALQDVQGVRPAMARPTAPRPAAATPRPAQPSRTARVRERGDARPSHTPAASPTAQTAPTPSVPPSSPAPQGFANAPQPVPTRADRSASPGRSTPRLTPSFSPLSHAVWAPASAVSDVEAKPARLTGAPTSPSTLGTLRAATTATRARVPTGRLHASQSPHAQIAHAWSDALHGAADPKRSTLSRTPGRVVPAYFTESQPANLGFLPPVRPSAQGTSTEAGPSPYAWLERLKQKGANARERAGLGARERQAPQGRLNAQTSPVRRVPVPVVQPSRVREQGQGSEPTPTPSSAPARTPTRTRPSPAVPRGRASQRASLAEASRTFAPHPQQISVEKPPGRPSSLITRGVSALSGSSTRSARPVSSTTPTASVPPRAYTPQTADASRSLLAHAQGRPADLWRDRGEEPETQAPSLSVAREISARGGGSAPRLRGAGRLVKATSPQAPVFVAHTERNAASTPRTVFALAPRRERAHAEASARPLTPSSSTAPSVRPVPRFVPLSGRSPSGAAAHLGPSEPSGSHGFALARPTPTDRLVPALRESVWERDNRGIVRVADDQRPAFVRADAASPPPTRRVFALAPRIEREQQRQARAGGPVSAHSAATASRPLPPTPRLTTSAPAPSFGYAREPRRAQIRKPQVPQTRVRSGGPSAEHAWDFGVRTPNAPHRPSVARGRSGVPPQTGISTPRALFRGPGTAASLFSAGAGVRNVGDSGQKEVLLEQTSARSEPSVRPARTDLRKRLEPAQTRWVREALEGRGPLAGKPLDPAIVQQITSEREAGAGKSQPDRSGKNDKTDFVYVGGRSSASAHYRSIRERAQPPRRVRAGASASGTSQVHPHASPTTYTKAQTLHRVEVKPPDLRPSSTATAEPEVAQAALNQLAEKELMAVLAGMIASNGEGAELLRRIEGLLDNRARLRRLREIG